ncbi:MAG: hypothetical protein ACREQ9_12935 [Candidatus Binatia bacterium]
MNTRFSSLRSAALAAAVLVVSSLATTALGFSDSYRLYTIEGYLDRAPEGATVVDRVEIGAIGTPRRQLLVTAYRSPGEILLDRYLSREFRSPYVLRGNRDYLSRLLEAPEGAPIKGTFAVYQQAIPSLLVAQLDRPA